MMHVDAVIAELAGGPEAVASHRSAAVLHDLRDIRAGVPEITLGGAFELRTRGVRTHRTRQLDAADRCVIDRVPTTTIPRTFLDLGAVLPFDTVELAAQDAMIRGLVSPVDLVCLLERVGRRGRSGTAGLRRIVRESIPDERLETDLERRLAALVQRAALPPPVLQFKIEVPGYGPARFDCFWPELRRVVEADGRRWHSTKRDFERDLIRCRGIQALGLSHHRYGWNDVVNHGLTVIAELHAMNWSAASTVTVF
jgi:hypothetical protein